MLSRVWVFLALLGVVPLAADPVTAGNFALAEKYSREHGGLATRVEQDGRVLFEDYYPGWDAHTARKIYSGTKNFVAITVLLAQQDHLLTLGEKASDTLIEWRNDRRKVITLAELLNQTSGLNPDSYAIDSAQDQMAAAVGIHLIAAPGTRFHYGAVNYQALGEILRRKLRARHQTVEDYMQDRLLHPLHLHVADWKHDDAGNPLMHAGMWFSAEEWAKFGAFINRERTEANGELIDHALFASMFVGSTANPAYGLSFWLNRAQPANRNQKMTDLQPAIDGEQLDPGGPVDLCAAIGSYRQRLYLIPSQKLVVVRFGYESKFSDGDFLSRLLTGKVQPDARTH